MHDEKLSTLKLNAAIKRGHFRTMDLFAGCGGFTLGFQRAGFRCLAAIEINDNARSSHTANFSTLSEPHEYCAYSDITQLDPFSAVAHLDYLNESPEQRIDIIIGGPPCQAFSALGRAALWHLEGNDQAHLNDKRASLFQYFLEYVAQLKPLAFVLENVPEIGRFGKVNVAEQIAIAANELGYETRYALLNAVWYGVPQLRDRMIIIGINKTLNLVPQFPEITYQYDLPTGYDTKRSSQGRVVVLEPSDHYVGHGVMSHHLTSAITTAQAFADLPEISHHLVNPTNSKKKRMDLEIPYTSNDNSFVREMRNWPSFSSNGHFTGHIIRNTPRDYETFKLMPEKGMYPEAVKVAEEIFASRLEEYFKNYGIKLTPDNPEWHNIRKATVPPYKTDKYPNKFRKLASNEPSHTVPAHLSKDTYSHIHFDSQQARGISVREAARLQSFPDAFKFVGGMNDQFMQIGNAVPPLMAYAIARTLLSQLFL